MSLIKSLHIRSFKSLKEVEIELGQINVFVGSNGAGKSNLLEGVGLLGAAASGTVDDESLSRRGVRLGLPSRYKSSFHGSRAPQHIDLEARSISGASYRVTLWNPLTNPSQYWQYKTEKLQAAGEPPVSRSPASMDPEKHTNNRSSYVALKLFDFDKDDSRVRLMQKLQEFGIYSPDTSTLRSLTPDRLQRQPVGLSGGGIQEAISAIRKDIRKRGHYEEVLEMFDWVLAFGSKDSSQLSLSRGVPAGRKSLWFQDRYMAEERDVLSGYEVSEGVLYVLFGLAMAIHPEAPSFLAVDNFDQALNPRLSAVYSSKLCNWVTSETDKQLLLTSHNPLVLDGLDLRDDRIRLFTVSRSSQGATQVARVEVTEKMLKAADGGLPLSRQWVMGNLGGIPNFG